MTGHLTSNRLCPAQAIIHTHTAWCIVAAGQRFKENASCRWTVPQVVSCTCVLWSVTVCPMLI